MIALAVIAQAGAAIFAPPIDTPMRVVTETERIDHGVTRRFVSARRIVFRRTDAGYRAELTIETGGPPEPGDDPAAMFHAAFARLAGRTIVFDLDTSGAVTEIADQAAVWQAMQEGVVALAPNGSDALARSRAARVRAIAATLNALPEARRRAMLTSLIEPLAAPALAAAGPAPPAPVRVPAASAFGRAEIEGLRVVRLAQGRLEATVMAEGPVHVEGPEGAASGRVTLETVRRVDPRSGLVIELREVVRTTGADGRIAAERRSVTRILH